MTYQTYLASEHWRQLREAARKRDGYCCQQCGSSRQIQVHHLKYRESWFATILSDLQTLCRQCHRKNHGIKPKDFKIWMPLSIEAELKQAGHLTTAEFGALILTKMAYWKNGGPVPLHFLRQICGRHFKKVSAQFVQLDDGRWRHLELDQEITRAKIKCEQ